MITWLVYAAAAVLMLGAVVSAVAFGLALRLGAEFLREFVVDGQGGDGPGRPVDEGSDAAPRAEGSGEVG